MLLCQWPSEVLPGCIDGTLTKIFQQQDIVVIRLSRIITIKSNFHGHRLPQYIWLRASKCALCHLGHTILVLHSRKKHITLIVIPAQVSEADQSRLIAAALIRKNLVFVNNAEYFYIMIKICPLNNVYTCSHYSVSQ